MMKTIKLLLLGIILLLISCEKEPPPFVDSCYNGYQVNKDSTACVCPPETHWEYDALEQCFSKSEDVFLYSVKDIPCLGPDHNVLGGLNYSKSYLLIRDSDFQKELMFRDGSYFSFNHELLKNEVNEKGERVIEAKLGGLYGRPTWLDCEIFREQFGDRFKHVEASMKSIRTADDNKKIDFEVIYRIKNVDSTFTTLDTGYIYAVKPW